MQRNLNGPKVLILSLQLNQQLASHNKKSCARDTWCIPVCLCDEIPCSFTASLNFRTGCCCRASRACVTEPRIRQDGLRHTATVLPFPSVFGSVWRLGSVTNSSISISPAFELCKTEMHAAISAFYWIN